MWKAQVSVLNMSEVWYTEAH